MSFTAQYYPKPGGGEVITKEGGVMAIGYNATGASPFTYFLRDGQDLDVGFLKVLFTTEPVELEGIAQASAFEADEGEVFPRAKEIQGVWGSQLYTIVQRRAKEGCE
jgi:hypothetical protein